MKAAKDADHMEELSALLDFTQGQHSSKPPEANWTAFRTQEGELAIVKAGALVRHEPTIGSSLGAQSSCILIMYIYIYILYTQYAYVYLYVCVYMCMYMYMCFRKPNGNGVSFNISRLSS